MLKIILQKIFYSCVGLILLVWMALSIPEGLAKCNSVLVLWTLERKSVTLLAGPATEQEVAQETESWSNRASLEYDYDSGNITFTARYFTVYSESANALY